MSAKKSLDALRGEIDAIDEEIHDLLMRRTSVVEKIGAAKGDPESAHRPGREALIIRRLMDRHAGAFPKQALVRVWREILTAFVRLQGPFSVAVHEPEDSCGFGDLARSHYGSQTPVTAHSSAPRVIDEVMRGRATVGVLPIPVRDDTQPWWPHLMSGEPAAPLVIARLPFAGPDNCRAEDPGALVISRVAPEETGRDRSLLALEADEDFSLASLGPALAECSLPVVFTAMWDDKETRGTRLYLAEVDNFIAATDDRRVKLFMDSTSLPIKRVIVLGSYAVPLTAEELAKAPAKRKRKS
ncbi:MAG: chorismate mutase [Rhodospirillales bacterium]|jgi:chorismate mutase-like protein|nr:chorismate mutase [Rhodospirillales bacterium]